MKFILVSVMVAVIGSEQQLFQKLAEDQKENKFD